MQETLYERNGRWLTSEQVQEFNRINKKPIETIVVNNILTGEDIEVTQEEIDNAEEITAEEARDLPVIEKSLVKLEEVAPIKIKEKEYAKETGSKTKKGGKKEGTK